jgi:hypothetical protein
VRDDHELGIFAEFSDDVIKFINIDIIEWSIHFIKNTEKVPASINKEKNNKAIAVSVFSPPLN